MNKKYLAVVGAVIGLSMVTHAAVLSWSSTAPAQDGSDIWNFSGVSVDTDNIAGGDDQGTYVAIGRDAVGQTFTTGGNGAGYLLNAITLQHVNYETYWSLDTGWNGYNAGSFEVQIGTIAGAVFTSLASESAPMDASAPGNQNPGTGSAQFATLTLSSPVMLTASTVYGFAVFSSNDGTTDPLNGPYFETNGDGTTSANYTEGEAFGLAASGAFPPVNDTVVSQTGDRVFHLDMVVVPEPATTGMIGAGAVLLLLHRNRPRKKIKIKRFAPNEEPAEW